jgi:hypothetical protein
MSLLHCDRATAVGFLELLWHFAAEFAPQGDIGRYEDRRIEAALDYLPHGQRRTGRLIQALVESRWIDADPVHRLVVHDWQDHCESNTLSKLSKAGLTVAKEGSKAAKARLKISKGTSKENADDENLSVRECLESKTSPALAFALALPEPYTQKQLRAPLASDQTSAPSHRFADFQKLYPRKQRMSQAAQAFVSVVDAANESQVFACLERYCDSEEVSRGVVMNPDKWLFSQAQDKWAGMWPARNGTHKAEDREYDDAIRRLMNP